MLIFVKGHYLPLIASGRKITTIRPWKTCTQRPGGTLWFNGKLSVVLNHVEQRRFGDLTDDDAWADGFASLSEFVTAFRSHYPATSDDALVWILTFDPPNDSPQSALAAAAGTTVDPT